LNFPDLPFQVGDPRLSFVEWLPGPMRISPDSNGTNIALNLATSASSFSR
jgi:hypothetical protein